MMSVYGTLFDIDLDAVHSSALGFRNVDGILKSTESDSIAADLADSPSVDNPQNSASATSAPVHHDASSDDRRDAHASSQGNYYKERHHKKIEPGLTCLSCGIGGGNIDGQSLPPFSSIEEQRLHYHTDWHRFNVKRRARGVPPMAQLQFHELVENGENDDDIGSLSGSDSDLEFDGATTDGRLAEEVIDATDDVPRVLKGPYFYLDVGDKERLAIWKSIVLDNKIEQCGETIEQYNSAFATLRAMQQQGCQWGIIMLSGGHFAAKIYDIRPPKRNERYEDAGDKSRTGMISLEDRKILHEVVSKSFHRYVVRAKAGGKQSSKDATGKYARSAGSRLRRYNESQLQKEVSELLNSWSEELEKCSTIFVVAPGSNGQLLFGSKGDIGLLNKDDPRIRKVPFVTRRPTMSEIRRILQLLLTVYSMPQIDESTKGNDSGTIGIEEKTPTEDLDAQTINTSAISNVLHDDGDDEKGRQMHQKEITEEDIRKSKNAEKKARKKARQKAARLAAKKSERAASESSNKSDRSDIDLDEEIANAVQQAVSLSTRKDAAPGKNKKKDEGKASKSYGIRSNPQKSHHNEDAAARRARLAAAAEARMKALSVASLEQTWHH